MKHLIGNICLLLSCVSLMFVFGCQSSIDAGSVTMAQKEHTEYFQNGSSEKVEIILPNGEK